MHQGSLAILCHKNNLLIPHLKTFLSLCMLSKGSSEKSRFNGKNNIKREVESIKDKRKRAKMDIPNS